MEPITEIALESGTIVDLTALPDDATEVFGVPGDYDTRVAVKCEACDEWFTDAEWQNSGMYGDLTEASLCESCYESDTTYPSTLHRFVPGEDKSDHEYVLFGDHKAYGASEDCLDEAFGWFTDLLPEDWKGRPYIHTDAWRGYFDTSSVLKGLKEVESGWMTGDYGDVPWKRDSHSFLQALTDGEITPPCVVYVLFEPTSNVFSTATTILAPEDKAAELAEWLTSGDYDLHGALS